MIYTDAQVENIKKIAQVLKYRIRYKQKLNRYDYYMMGGISFKRGHKILCQMYADKKINESQFYLVNTYIEGELAYGASRRQDFIMKTHYQYGDRVITLDEKKMIKEKLMAYGIDECDIDDLVFSGAVRNYAITNGLIPKIKKKIK